MAISNKEMVNRIKDLISEKGKTQRYFCELFGVKDSFFASVKAGKCGISQERLEILANDLDTTVDYLTGKTDVKEKPGSERLDAETVQMLMLWKKATHTQKEQILDYAKYLTSK